ncbi:hypothetical protein Gasu2_14430 [Galdieria sulphuraria]|uniref:Voltage-dependent anion channel, MPP family n=1 Tax=Galdieria sulphuraria TaxID=130081 RepID=M2XFD6_GALSU|nr:voltage-dependent anion channel, MPP family [Galdieria sulphuraria]EME28717.1 voltage-dependent anion channel, MPP family [Galdieria sulphuraria]GJD07061.1 hypothetical protein Gasu2_14430 [Galdieria sulphuraria]|eukprot:XP_005705237.1 voltage-dependent anion channel, MPP family [Galdieria sulphuraria]
MLDSFRLSAQEFQTRDNQSRLALCPLFSKIGDYVSRVLQDGYFTGVNFGVGTQTKQGIIYQLQGKTYSGTEPFFAGQWNQEIPFQQETSWIDRGSFGVRLLSKGPVCCESVLDMSKRFGLMATLSAFESDHERFKAQFDWQRKHVALSTNFIFGVAPKMETSLVVGFSNLLLATQLALEPTFKFPSWVVACNYQDGDSGQITLFIHDRGPSVTCSYLHNVSGRLSVAARFVYSSNIEQRSLVFGTQYYLDNDTLLKAKVDSSGTIALSCIQQLTRSAPWKVQIGISSFIDVASVEKKSPAMGVSLQVES